jgi:hypothetical protein
MAPNSEGREIPNGAESGGVRDFAPFGIWRCSGPARFGIPRG